MLETEGGGGRDRLTGAQKHEEQQEVHPGRGAPAEVLTRVVLLAAGHRLGGRPGRWAGPETRRSSPRPIRGEPAAAVIELRK